MREGLVAFFNKALHRDPEKRFDNADEMRSAWQKVFKDAEQSEDQKAERRGDRSLGIPLEQAELDTRLRRLDLSARARNALERAERHHGRRPVAMSPINDIHMMRGVGDQYPAGDHRFHRRVASEVPEHQAARRHPSPRTTLPPSLEQLHQSSLSGIEVGKNELNGTSVRVAQHCRQRTVTPADTGPASQMLPTHLEMTRAQSARFLRPTEALGQRWTASRRFAMNCASRSSGSAASSRSPI